MFYAYAALGLIGAALYRRLPHARCDDGAQGAARAVARTVYKLAALFSLDSFAGGFAVQSLLALWLFERFDLSLSAASLFFFWSSVLAAFSYPVAAWLAGRIGLVNTMVFTHIPSSIFLILAAFSPNLYLVLALLLLRSALSQMDVPTRTSYVMAVVTPAERTAAASVTAVPRSLASAISPALAGALLPTPFSGLAAGGLRRAEDRLRPGAAFTPEEQGRGSSPFLPGDLREGLHRSALIANMRPRFQLYFRGAGIGFFRAKGDFLACLDLVLGGLREPVPFFLVR